MRKRWKIKEKMKEKKKRSVVSLQFTTNIM